MPNMNRIALRLLAAALVLSHAGLVRAQSASDYPSRAVRLIVPHPAGGAADVVARLVADKLGAKWKQPVLVENRPSVGGNVGAEFVYRADPDGYTLLAGTPGPIAINGSLFKTLRYDQSRFVPVSILTVQPTVLAVRKDIAARSVTELIAMAKASPGKMTFASQGNGTTSHLTAKLFESLTGAQLVHVPYQGTGPALNDLMGGRVDMLFDNPVGTLPPYRAGRLGILAVATPKRQQTLPDIPTFAEIGLPDFTGGAWIGVVAPPGTPAPVVERVSAAMAEALEHADVRAKLAALGADTVGSRPAQAAEFVAQERERWRKVIESAKVSVD
jgi:tripartite-type tricarboxylate transporter receptor subunit TctC